MEASLIPTIDDIASAVQTRDVQRVTDLLFESRNGKPTVRNGMAGESELWDYKQMLPLDVVGWAKIAKHVLAFHNNRGGAIVFGVSNSGDTKFVDVFADAKLFNDKIRRYVGEGLWVYFQRVHIQNDQSYIGIAIIPKRGPWVTRFKSNAPEINGKNMFMAGDIAYRDGDQSRIYSGAAAERLVRELNIPDSSSRWFVNEQLFRIPSPDYNRFVIREKLCSYVRDALYSERSYVTSLSGIGGVGKTALATWAVIEAYEQKKFEYIVSVTAKDRELSTSGIAALQASLSSFDDLLDSILDVLGFREMLEATPEEKQHQVRALMTGVNGLLFVDNLETVDDQRTIDFLEQLPIGPRVIVTSRRPRVRVSVTPVDVGPFEQDEAREFLRRYAAEKRLSAIANLHDTEVDLILTACDRLPLAIKWFVGRHPLADQAIREAKAWVDQGRHDDELLEFSYRRVYESVSALEKAVLQVVSIFQRPVAYEALVIATDGRADLVLDAIEELVALSLLERSYDADLNDYSYAMLPITRSFTYTEVGRQRGLEAKFRHRLQQYYEARDVVDAKSRVVISAQRQGKTGDDALVDIALQYIHEHDCDNAKELLTQAISRNPNNWRACREYAELCRHQLGMPGEALKYYEQAASRVPKSSRMYRLIFREWGLLLRSSGTADASRLATNKLEIALAADPKDHICRHALAETYRRQGKYRKAIEIAEPLLEHYSLETRTRTYPLLLEAYDATKEVVKAAELRLRMGTEK